jgi:hypothetical protein
LSLASGSGNLVYRFCAVSVPGAVSGHGHVSEVIGADR